MWLRRDTSPMVHLHITSLQLVLPSLSLLTRLIQMIVNYLLRQSSSFIALFRYPTFLTSMILHFQHKSGRSMVSISSFLLTSLFASPHCGWALKVCEQLSSLSVPVDPAPSPPMPGRRFSYHSSLISYNR